MPAPRLNDRTFGLIFATIFTIVFGMAWFVFQTRLDWALITAGIFLATALVLPSALLPLNRLWGRIAYKIAIFNNYLLLGLFFFLILTPFSIVMRLAKHDPLRRKLGPTAELKNFSAREFQWLIPLYISQN